MNLLLLLSLCWLSSWGLQNVYITPDGNCYTANGTELEPCYTLNQSLNLSSDLLEPSVTLKFLPGIHMLQGGHGIIKYEQVILSPLNVKEKVIINCLHFSQNYTFFASHSITISSLHFTTCTLAFTGNATVNITNSVFERSYSTSLVFDCKVNCGRSHIYIANCSFLSNAVGISCGDVSIIENYFPQQIFPQHGPQLSITNTLFQDNGVINGDGVLIANNYTINVYNTLFIQNTIVSIMAYSSTLTVVNTTFYMNHADGGSGIYAYYSRALNVSNCFFVDNSAFGGVILIIKCGEVCLITNSRFQGNVAEMGGAINAIKDYNGDKYSGGQLFIHDCQFVNNSAEQGGALWLSGSQFNIDITASTFTSNKAEQGGAVYSGRSHISLSYDSFTSNSATSNGGAVYLSQGTFRSINVTINGNTALLNGGAMYVEHNLYIWTRNLTVANNIALNKGGAIFISDEDCNPYSCITEILEATFSNNSANQGQILYGGLLDRCCVYNANGHCLSGIEYLKQNSHYADSKAAITSKPVRVCLCNENSEVDCTTRNLTVDKQRGQTINLRIAVVDQDSKSKKGFVRASYLDFLAGFGEGGEDRQQTGDNCIDMSFHVVTRTDSVVQLVLAPEGICEQSDFSSITVNVNVIPCTRGFVRKYDKCVCDPRLTGYIRSCDADALIIVAKDSRVWVYFYKQFLKVHINCPLDHCSVSSTICLSSQDEQCANHRSGVICGSCQDNYSIALGGSKCLDCSSSIAYAWLIPVFAVAGIALVALLFVFNMTVSHGTLNGLIFYANVVSIFKLTGFQDCSIHPLLSVFIAWVNLDFGVETCFYPGMDTYQKTWLQFAFPLYIWILVGTIILISHYSTRVMKVFGKSNIAVLATLFLLSYTKLFKSIITVFYFTKVLRGSATNTSDPLVPYRVWLYDGSVEYLTGKHVPLFAVALAFLVFLFLPYTLLLTFGQCIRSIQSRNKYVLWFINSTAFISIMDAYHAPYTNRHRYWTGFLVSCIVFLTFISNFDNYFATVICLAIVISLRAVISKVYKCFGVNLLEIIFLLNLTVLFASVRNGNSNDRVLCKCATASISISLVLFIGILVYHAYIRIKSKKFFKSFEGWLRVKWQIFRHQYKRAKPIDDNVLPEANLPEGPTTSYVELREKLLEN